MKMQTICNPVVDLSHSPMNQSIRTKKKPTFKSNMRKGSLLMPGSGCQASWQRSVTRLVKLLSLSQGSGECQPDSRAMGNPFKTV